MAGYLQSGYQNKKKENETMKKKSSSRIINSSNGGSYDSRMRKVIGSEEVQKEYTIGIEQFAEHGSLDNCRGGFLKGLEAEGIKRRQPDGQV